MNSRADALEEVPEMIERVAKAIHGQLFALFDADIGSEDAMPDLRAAARTAIEAMRDAPLVIWGDEYSDSLEAFNHVIDAALK